MGRFRRALAVAALLAALAGLTSAQTETGSSGIVFHADAKEQRDGSSAAVKYLDPVGGSSAEEMVRRALEQNGELMAARQQIQAGRGAVAQARLRANPMIEFSSQKQFKGSDNSILILGSVPLELFGRKARRVEVAERELEVVQHELADRERQLAGSVRTKFGEALAAARNLRFVEDLLKLNRESLRLIAARVEKGATAPLEESIVRVEVNRIDALRTGYEAKVEIAMLELKSLVGMKSDEPLHLMGDLDVVPVSNTRDQSVAQSLALRPDLRAARAAEQLAEARVRQAATEGKPDASLFGNYQRMDFGFDVNGLNATGGLQRVQGIFNYFTVGVSLSLPVRNRNQGAVQSALAQTESAKQRRQFAELVIGREVAAAFVRYEKARQSQEIYDRGVREQALSNLKIIRQTYEAGRTPLLDVIAEQRRYIEIELAYTDVLNQYYQSVVELRRAIGAEF